MSKEENSFWTCFNTAIAISNSRPTKPIKPYWEHSSCPDYSEEVYQELCCDFLPKTSDRRPIHLQAWKELLGFENNNILGRCFWGYLLYSLRIQDLNWNSATMGDGFAVNSFETSIKVNLNCLLNFLNYTANNLAYADGVNEHRIREAIQGIECYLQGVVPSESEVKPSTQEFEEWRRDENLETLRPFVTAIAIIIPVVFAWMVFQ